MRECRTLWRTCSFQEFSAFWPWSKTSPASAWRAVPIPRCRASAWSLCKAEVELEMRNFRLALFLSALRSHEPVETLRALDVMVHVSYPLTARNGHVEIFNAIVEVRRDAVPEKSWKFIDDIGWR